MSIVGWSPKMSSFPLINSGADYIPGGHCLKGNSNNGTELKLDEVYKGNFTLVNRWGIMMNNKLLY